MLTTDMVIEAIVEGALLDHKDNLRAKLQELCRLAMEEQRAEFRRIASMPPVPLHTH